MSENAQNDDLVEEFISDSDYDIRMNGEIWTKKPRNGRKVDGVTYRFFRRAEVNINGYLGINYKGKILYAHRIVFRKYVDYLDSAKVINHKDENKSNNHPENLELVSQRTNSFYSSSGERNIQSKLTDLEREDLITLYEHNEYSQKCLAKIYGISQTTISAMIKRRK